MLDVVGPGAQLLRLACEAYSTACALVSTQRWPAGGGVGRGAQQARPHQSRDAALASIQLQHTTLNSGATRSATAAGAGADSDSDGGDPHGPSAMTPLAVADADASRCQGRL